MSERVSPLYIVCHIGQHCVIVVNVFVFLEDLLPGDCMKLSFFSTAVSFDAITVN